MILVLKIFYFPIISTFLSSVYTVLCNSAKKVLWNIKHTDDITLELWTNYFQTIEIKWINTFHL